MGLVPETARGELGDAPRAVLDFEHTVAATAVKVVMMPLASDLVTTRSTGQLDGTQRAVFDHRLDVAVNGGDTQGRSALLSLV